MSPQKQAQRIRRVAVLAVAGALFGLARSPVAQETAAPSIGLKADDIDRMMKDLSNWGRWGADDQRGTINLITAAKRKAAAGLVKVGTSVSLSSNPSTEKAVDNPAPLELVMNPIRPGAGVALDTWRVAHHGFTFTHLDALCHWAYKGKTYNGFEFAAEVTAKGCAKAGIEQMKNGILARGLLVDIPQLKGVPYLEPGTPITGDDIEAWEKRTRVHIEAGDVVLIRTGRWGRRMTLGPFSIQGRSAGVHISAVPLFKARDIALLGTDVGLDVNPTGVEGVGNPVHTVVLTALGLPVIDNADLEELSKTAARLNRWTFMFSGAPIPVTGGTGSLINAIATF
jgi:kynurenine formamidase